MTTRRRFLTGLLSAPAVITTPGLLMPVRAWGEANPDFLQLGANYPKFASWVHAKVLAGLQRDFVLYGTAFTMVDGNGAHEVEIARYSPLEVFDAQTP